MASAKEEAAEAAYLAREATYYSRGDRVERRDRRKALEKAQGHSYYNASHLRDRSLNVQRGRAPLGTRRTATTLDAKPPRHNITGVNHKFVKRLAPTAFGTRGSWKSSRAHHFKKRLAVRKKRSIHVKGWHHRKVHQTPR